MLRREEFDTGCWNGTVKASYPTAPSRVLAILLVSVAAAVTVGSSSAPSPGTALPGVRNTTPTVPAATSAAPVLPAMRFIDMPANKARRLNAATPFSAEPNPAARPFRFSGDDASRLRAIDCLASAEYYEAGDDPEGERAVAQVVLNRVRHPAFPATICGVVYQGAERATGCQFTFTCDGAMARRPLPRPWERARLIAREAIDGNVYAAVGLATHYHTDWVRPTWSGKLEKVTRVGPHLFFRWPDGWGRPAAFHQPRPSTEPFEMRLAAVSAAHQPVLVESTQAASTSTGEETIEPDLASATASMKAINMRGAKLRLVHPQGDAFGFLLPDALPGSFGLLALDVCRGRSFCKVMGWTDPGAIPAGFPIPYDARQKMVFLYVRDGVRSGGIVAWNCAVFARSDPEECLNDRTRQWDAVRQVASVP